MNDFLVLGDLTERVLGEYVSPARHLIVRMFVGADTFDEEFEVASLDELRPAVEAKMAALAHTPEPELQVEAERPRIDPGHALDIPAAAETA